MRGQRGSVPDTIANLAASFVVLRAPLRHFRNKLPHQLVGGHFFRWHRHIAARGAKRQVAGGIKTGGEGFVVHGFQQLRSGAGDGSVHVGSFVPPNHGNRNWKDVESYL